MNNVYIRYRAVAVFGVILAGIAWGLLTGKMWWSVGMATMDWCWMMMLGMIAAVSVIGLGVLALGKGTRYALTAGMSRHRIRHGSEEHGDCNMSTLIRRRTIKSRCPVCEGVIDSRPVKYGSKVMVPCPDCTQMVVVEVEHVADPPPTAATPVPTRAKRR